MKLRATATLFWLTAALAAVSVGLAAGPLAWRFAGESGLPPPPAAGPEAPRAAAASIDPILALSPFGRLARAAPAAPVEETDLGLTLNGVVIGGAGGASRAIVTGPEGPAASYAVGQEVAPGAILAEVRADQVVLLVDGARETLSFPERRDASGGGVAALRALVGAPAATPGADSTDPEAVIARYRERIAANPQTVLDGLGLTATPEGYQVGASASAGVRQAGLRPGDVVAKVNGQQVGNIELDRRFFDAVAASGRARIEVVRDGQTVVMSFPLR